ncbi:hypothetical protein Anapl_05619 [Anas platyrhynchos]|uniref:Uncharacterized protein n=1 Tax=Anas platyrhynchos TaxID=8839 RepID=R0JWD2_ANAPL|nr:hypothetical protein Anapl_05619 [Anas platyrhynchos]
MDHGPGAQTPSGTLNPPSPQQPARVSTNKDGAAVLGILPQAAEPAPSSPTDENEVGARLARETLLLTYSLIDIMALELENKAANLYMLLHQQQEDSSCKKFTINYPSYSFQARTK